MIGINSRIMKIIFAVEDQEKEWDPSMFIQDISSPKPRVNTHAPNMKDFGLWESDEDNIYGNFTR